MAQKKNQESEGGTAVEDQPVRVGDIVNYVTLFGAYPTIESRNHFGIVDAIYPDGDLALFVGGRQGMKLQAKVREDPTGQKMDTWHRRD